MFNRLNLRPQASPQLAALLALPWLASFIILLWLELPLWLLAVALPLHVGMASLHIRLLALNARARSVVALKLNDSQFRLELRDSTEHTVTLKPESFISKWFCILRFAEMESSRCHTVILCRWNLRQQEAQQQLRRLRIKLRFDPALTNSPSTEL